MALPTELGLWFQTEHRKMLPLEAKRRLVFGQHFRQIENPDSMSLSDSGAVLPWNPLCAIIGSSFFPSHHSVGCMAATFLFL